MSGKISITRRISKALVIGIIFGLIFSQGAIAAAQSGEFLRGEDPLISPPTEERVIKEAGIDAEYIEVSAFYGLYALDGFASSPVSGARLALHLTEDIFFEGSYGMTEADQEVFERLTARLLLTDTEIIYWNVNVAYNLFPGQIFLSRKKTINSTIFLIGGLGQTQVDNRDHFTSNFGIGYRAFITDWLDARIQYTVHSFETDLTGVKERIYNLEGTVGLAIFF